MPVEPAQANPNRQSAFLPPRPPPRTSAPAATTAFVSPLRDCTPARTYATDFTPSPQISHRSHPTPHARLTPQELPLPHPRPQLALSLLLALAASLPAQKPSSPAQKPSPSPQDFEILTHRFDVDVDGAPNAYGPAGSHPLDELRDAHYRGRRHAEIVGYLTDDDDPSVPIPQGPHDPFPGYYISQTAFTDPAIQDPRNPRRYVDATKINYVVLGNAAHRKGARLGDFVAVYSNRTHRSAFAIVADDGNPSGDEGSLHLLQALGYPFRNGIDDAIEGREIRIRFYPNSNPHQLFFRSQQALDAAATRLGLSRNF